MVEPGVAACLDTLKPLAASNESLKINFEPLACIVDMFMLLDSGRDRITATAAYSGADSGRDNAETSGFLAKPLSARHNC